MAATMLTNTDRSFFGHVASIAGSNANVRLVAPVRSDRADDFRVTVGNFLALQTGKSTVVSVITEACGDSGKGDGTLTARVDLLGEIKLGENGTSFFQRGVAEYPAVGDRVAALSGEALHIVYDTGDVNTITIGHLQHDSSIQAHIKVDEMLRKHFALLAALARASRAAWS